MRAYHHSDDCTALRLTTKMLSLLVGALFIAVAGWASRHARTDPSWHMTVGEVVGVRALSGTQWAPVVRYRYGDVEGQVVGTVGQRPRPQLGERLTVAVDPSHPNRAKLPDDEQSGRATLRYFAALGAAAMLLGAAQLTGLIR